MSGRRFILIAFALVLFGVGVPLSTSAQPASDDENLQVVLQAFRTARREGYHFRSKSLTTNTYTKADGSTLFYYFALDQEGDVAPNDDYQQLLRIRVATSLEALKTFPPITLTALDYNGDIYLYFDPDDKPALQVFSLPSGWWRLSDFRAHVTDFAARTLIDNAVSGGTPADIVYDSSYLLSVTYTSTQHNENRIVRNYTTQHNVLSIILTGLPGQGSAHLANDLRYMPLFLSSNLSLSLQLQIGEQDGRLYQVSMDSRRGIPFLSAGYGSEQPYDMENDSLADVTFTYPFAPVVISPPDSSLLNH